MFIYLQMIETVDDRSKFEQIYLEYRSLMYHVAFKLLQHEQDAEDAVHHAFMKIAENIKIVEPVSPKTRCFVATIVENRAKDILRSRSRQPILPLNEAVTAAADDLDNEDYLSQCIGQLTDLQQQVIWLKYYHGYDLREIAKLLDISLSWAQKIDQRAKKKLAEMLQQGGCVL